MNVWQNWFKVAWKGYTEKEPSLTIGEMRTSALEDIVVGLTTDVGALQLSLAKMACRVNDLEDHTLTTLEGFLTQIEKLQECERPIAIATARSREPKPHTRSHRKTLRLSPAAAIRRAKRK